MVIMYQHFPFSIWFTNQCIDCNGVHVNDNQKLSANAPPCHIIGATRKLLIAINKSCRQCGSLLISALDNSFSVSTLYSQFPPYARICIQKAISQQLLWESFSPPPFNQYGLLGNTVSLFIEWLGGICAKKLMDKKLKIGHCWKERCERCSHASHENLIAVNLAAQIFLPEKRKISVAVREVEKIKVANQLCKSVLSRAENFLEKMFTDRIDLWAQRLNKRSVQCTGHSQWNAWLETLIYGWMKTKKSSKKVLFAWLDNAIHIRPIHGKTGHMV